MLDFKYRKCNPIDAITLHAENLTATSQMKSIILQIFSTRRFIMKSNRGPAMVEQRLITNLKSLDFEISNKIDWILNVNSKANWESLRIESNNLILGPNIEFELNFVREKVQNVMNMVILVPSDWVIPVLKKRLDWYKGRYVVWQSDLDLDFWKPSKNVKQKYILIYRKYDNSDDDFLQIIKCCEKLGLKYKVITYGKYGRKSFRKCLRNAIFAVWLGTTESQGIALLECWSTNIPTLVREKKEYYDEITGEIFASSSAPYLTNKCGNFFNMDEFDCETLAKFIPLSRGLAPREYVLEHYSKSKTDSELIALLKSLNS